MPTTLSIELFSGTLVIHPDPGTVPLQRLLGFASRYSSQRKFLFVSKILGKHYPVSNTLLRWSYRAIARNIMPLLCAGDSVWVGMAETATGLGYGVYAAARQSGLQQAVFLQTSRYHLAGQEFLAFQEAHSHATDFFLYLPAAAHLRQRFAHASSLVLIDDEISTGKTFLRLIQAYIALNPSLTQVFIVSLVNFASLTDRTTLEQEAGIAVHWIYLRSGQWVFSEKTQAPLAPPAINVSSNQACKRHLLAWPGRLGIEAPIQLSPDTLNRLLPLLSPNALQLKQAVLVLGTGECNAPALLLANVLEQHGLRVKVQATTRSPILVGHDIRCREEFSDNYDDNIANFIYNLEPDAYQAIILCHETPLNPAINSLMTRWQAISARFALSPTALDTVEHTYATLHFSRP